MSRPSSFRLGRRGTAAAELAMVMPLLLLILFGSSELGRFFYDQHILTKALRDGAVFAAHQPIENFDCTAAPPAVNSAVVDQTEALVRTGALSGSDDLLPHWDDADFTMTLACVTSAGGTTMGGLYSVNNNQVPVLTVQATVPYQPVTGFLGATFDSLSLSASQQASVVGI